MTVTAEVARLVGDEVLRAVGADEAMLAVVAGTDGGAGRSEVPDDAAGPGAGEAGALAGLR